MMVVLANGTPFSAETFVLPDRDGQEVLLTVVVAVFTCTAGGELKLADAQRPVRVADVHWGDPGSSSLRYEAELALEKPRAEVLVNANAWSPGGLAARTVPVELHFGDVHKKLMIYGDRRRWGGLLAAQPQPFVSMPIIYERTFGGTNAKPGILPKRQADTRNLVGVGFHGAPSASPEVQSAYPNVEYPGNSDVPAGFGPIARGWKPRIAYAGTYDKAWIAERAPLLPHDFNPLHNQSAPEDQQLSSIEGGERVQLINLTPNGIWDFRLPRLDVPMRLFYQDREEMAKLRVDTVLLEPDDLRITMTARLALQLPRGPGALEEIALGHMKPSWLKARRKSKYYADRRGDRGADPARACFLVS